MTKPGSEILRALPKIDELLRREEVRDAGAGLAADRLAEAVREAVADLRGEALAGRLTGAQLRARLARLPEDLRLRVAGLSRSTLRPVVNATGVLVHTNLGRAPLPEGAVERVVEAARGYVALEYDLALGERGSRGEHLARLGALLFPGCSLHAVNNNAAAVLLVLNTLAEGREVIISRGELVEIGGSFRIPDIMSRSGAILREVGTTNRTRLSDYQRSLSPATGMILRVHPSNYRIVGFTGSPSLEELAALGRGANVPVVVDQGSGSLLEMASVGIRDEPTVGEILQSGADLVLFSADKMLGGPQAGILVGRPELVGRCHDNPLSRALRLDKMTIAALEWTLQRYLAGRGAEDIPIQRMLREPVEAVGRRARRLVKELRKISGDRVTAEVVPSEAMAGGGAAPVTGIPSRAIALAVKGLTAAQLEERLRLAEPPVITRIAEGRVLADLRGVQPGEEKILVAAISAVARQTRPAGDGPVEESL